MSTTINLGEDIRRFKEEYRKNASTRLKEHGGEAILQAITDVKKINLRTFAGIINEDPGNVILSEHNLIKSEQRIFRGAFSDFLLEEEQKIYQNAVQEINKTQSDEKDKNRCLTYLKRELQSPGVQNYPKGINPELSAIIDSADQQFAEIRKIRKSLNHTRSKIISALAWTTAGAILGSSVTGTDNPISEQDNAQSTITTIDQTKTHQTITAMTPQDFQDAFTTKHQDFINQQTCYMQDVVDKSTLDGRVENNMKQAIALFLKEIYQGKTFSSEDYNTHLQQANIKPTPQLLNIGKALLNIQEDYKIKYQEFLENEKMAQVIGVSNAIFGIKKTTSLQDYQTLQKAITDISQQQEVAVDQLVKKLSKEYSEEELIFISQMLKNFQNNSQTIKQAQEQSQKN